MQYYPIFKETSLKYFTIYTLDPQGGIKYSVKRLRKTEATDKRFTNTNGMVRYQECESDCK